MHELGNTSYISFFLGKATPLRSARGWGSIGLQNNILQRSPVGTVSDAMVGISHSCIIIGECQGVGESECAYAHPGLVTRCVRRMRLVRDASMELRGSKGQRFSRKASANFNFVRRPQQRIWAPIFGIGRGRKSLLPAVSQNALLQCLAFALSPSPEQDTLLLYATMPSSPLYDTT